MALFCELPPWPRLLVGESSPLKGISPGSAAAGKKSFFKERAILSAENSNLKEGRLNFVRVRVYVS